MACQSSQKEEVETYSQTTTGLNSSSDTCLVNINTLKGNSYINYTSGEQVFLRSKNEANWQLEVYSLADCSMKAAYPLPENFSADFPYFLADINYNTSQRKVGIRGYKDLFVVDLDQQQVGQSLTPAFLQDRLADAESGQILHLEVWEDYLVGTTQDWGAFVFRLDSNKVTAIMPMAEVETPAGDFRSLFLIEDGTGTYQAILPAMAEDSGDFSVNALFDKPLPIDPEATVFADGSQYVRLKNKAEGLIGINLYTGELLPVIEEVE